MTEEYYKRIEASFNEGLLFAVQATTGKMIEILQQHNSGIAPAAKQQLVAAFELAAKRMLVKRGIMPYSYDVISGKVENVELDFTLRL